MVLVGPEEPLVKGIVDLFRKDKALQQVAIIGPSQYGAQLEGQKAFAKKFMMRHNIPTALYREFDATIMQKASLTCSTIALPIVLKADGLAAGKGY